MGSPSKWHPEVASKALAMMDDGVPIRKIAEEFGMTRNAALGRLWRLTKNNRPQKISSVRDKRAWKDLGSAGDEAIYGSHTDKCYVQPHQYRTITKDESVVELWRQRHAQWLRGGRNAPSA